MDKTEAVLMRKLGKRIGVWMLGLTLAPIPPAHLFGAIDPRLPMGLAKGY